MKVDIKLSTNSMETLHVSRATRLTSSGSELVPTPASSNSPCSSSAHSYGICLATETLFLCRKLMNDFLLVVLFHVANISWQNLTSLLLLVTNSKPGNTATNLPLYSLWPILLMFFMFQLSLVYQKQIC